MVDPHTAFTVVPFPRERQVTVDGGRLASGKHTIYGLVEMDVTKPRQYLREYKARTGESLSFTAFVIYCLAQAIQFDKSVQALRNWRNQLVVFNDVDVNTMIEIEMEGHKAIIPHFIRGADKMTLLEIHREIRAAQTNPQGTREYGIRWFARLPQFARDIFYWVVFKQPHWLKTSLGTVGMTSVGMFGTGTGWAIPFGIRTLDIALGGIAEKPGVVDGRIEVREYLHVTICFDHDIVDGAPAARFTARFKELVENGCGLQVFEQSAPPVSGAAGGK
jgi:pyruvate/2-oxoglutarate dehydrogenase complex dihydrolipoamide acyltransferase (E2) component